MARIASGRVIGAFCLAIHASTAASRFAVKLSHVKSIGSFWTEIYQETMASDVYYTGGDVDDAIQVLTEANAVPVD
jgi:hypothetical protein